jgi:hypothetical protein
MKVNHRGTLETVEVTADGEGFCSHAGALLLVNLADRLGLTAGLSKALAGTRQRRSAHDDGEILRDLIVTLVAGGEHLSDMTALRDQPDLFGNVASDSTAFRLIERIGPSELEGLRAARKAARERAFALGARPEKLILDVDATLVGSHSDKEHARGNYKGGYGFHPMLCYLDDSDGALDGILRPGNAGSNTGADQTQAVELALQQLPEGCMQEEILVRGDSAACVHELIDFYRDARMHFSVGHDLDSEVREAIAKLPEDAWVPAIPGREARHRSSLETAQSLCRGADRAARPLWVGRRLAAALPSRACSPRRPTLANRHGRLAPPGVPHRPRR